MECSNNNVLVLLEQGRVFRSIRNFAYFEMGKLVTKYKKISPVTNSFQLGPHTKLLGVIERENVIAL